VERLCTHVGIIARGRLVLQAAMQELKSGRTLEERFLEVVGAGARETQTLSWLEGGS
jgi:ABC-2 type transport system ATP-binding protein